jgi:hypothetical protein
VLFVLEFLVLFSWEHNVVVVVVSWPYGFGGTARSLATTPN